MMSGINDELIPAARLLLATLFLIFGLRKLRDYSGTVSQMVQLGVPTPALTAAVATFMELPVAFAVAVGAFARPSAATYVFFHTGNCAYLASPLDNNRCGSSGQHGQLYKNLASMGGFLLLYMTGAGKYSIEVLCGVVAP
jgi:putative oxidoreductase